jgi:hypothetical protein
MPAPHLAQDYKYLNNVNLEHRLIGFQATLVPFLPNISAGRLDMLASHLNQAMPLDGAEFPFIFSGYEQNLGEYEFSKTRRDQDIRVLAVIPKYPVIHGERKINNNPSLTVIYQGLEDNKLHYMTVERYTKCSDGFGYENVYLNNHLLNVNQIIHKETQLVTSPIHKDGLYCLGVNANVAYMTLEETIEDAMLISQSLADKMETTEIHRETITLDVAQHPLNTYGDDTEFKFLPDIGEVVNASGILFGCRPINGETFISDTQPASLSTPQFIHDKIYYAPPGSEILDIEFHVARGAKYSKHLYSQMEKYTFAANRYWKEVIAVYQQYRNQYKLSDPFHTHVTTAIQRLTAAGETVPGFPRRAKTKLIAKNKRPIEFMQVTITYRSKRSCANGFKTTGRDGAKGVICRVAKDEDMPVDDFGFRADIVIDPASVHARMNVGQMYEQAINRTSEFVRRRLAELYYSGNKPAGWDLLVGYCKDINPNFGDLIEETKRLPGTPIGSTDQKMDRYMENCIQNGISLHVPPGLDTIGMPLIKKLRDKYQIPLSPVTFTQRDEDDNVINTFRTKANVCIGSKYLYLLCKIPDPSSPGIAHVNQYSTPMKPPPSDRLLHPIRRAPIRFGEDEGRISLMDLADPKEVMRLMCLQANSQKGVDLMIKELLTNPYPTRINRIPISNEDLLNSNIIVLMFRHQMATIGLDSTRLGPFPVRERTLIKDKKVA